MMDTASSTSIAQQTLLSCGLILAVGTLAAFLAQRTRAPDVATFLAILMTILLHAPTMEWLGRRLRLLESAGNQKPTAP